MDFSFILTLLAVLAALFAPFLLLCFGKAISKWLDFNTGLADKIWRDK